MLTLDAAHRLVSEHLGASSRARHSLFVGQLMKRLAAHLEDDPLVWELVGLCHDLDFRVTEQQREQHGLITALWLAGELPPEALDAIKAHDHRTGFTADTGIAAALKLADACAIMLDMIGEGARDVLRSPDPWPGLAGKLSGRPYLAGIVKVNCERLDLQPVELANLLESMPPSS